MSFVLYSILSGTFAALASVFAKLFTDTRTVLITRYFCDLLNYFQNFQFLNCKEIEQSDDNTSENIIYLIGIIRIICFLLISLCNALMWTFFTKALNKSSSSIRVTVLNSATNFCMTAIMGNIIFNETLSLQWWFGANLIILGTVLVISNKGLNKDDQKLKEKVQ
ncbi:hypothetical protein Glove_227g59 [Diversispora epigaea]|uniref:EamA domain-containing protein n=1 Tax=Diversispora epigaea TaxID=1348612 RepID=A0A397IEK8_9GLOM|nr:hypothetical protein Glove_227g59 [Diversispora epigaea]